MSEVNGSRLDRLKGVTVRWGSAASAFARRRGTRMVVLGTAGLAGWAIWAHPPVQSVEREELGVRINRWSGGHATTGDGVVVVLPMVHELRRFPLGIQTYRSAGGDAAKGGTSFQTVEGLSIGVDVVVRYAVDPARISALAHLHPEDIAARVVDPSAQGVLYKTLSRYTVREIFSTKRPEIKHALESELAPLLAADGLKLSSVAIGRVDLPPDYKAGMEKLLAEELAADRMRYTLELKDKQVKQSELEALADKARRETAAEAAAQEQIIAARAQAEAMKHVLPFKQKQIEQRGLEAEAAKVARIKSAEAEAKAREIEATGEAESRRKLADAEAYRQERIGAVASAQLERDGVLISKNPLLIQKTLADKLSDKIQVIIAPPSADGGFVAASLIGGARTAMAAPTSPETDPPAVQQDARIDTHQRSE